MESAFELNPSEIRQPLVIVEGGRRFRVTHIFRPPKLADWKLYQERFGLSKEREGQQEIWSDSREEAAQLMWNEVALGVEGYLLPAGSESDWRDRVPVIHKVMGIDSLARVGVAEEQEEPGYSLESPSRKVYLEARRGGLVYSNLTHVFNEPSELETKKFRRIRASILRVRGSRTDKSIYPSHLAEMVGFYDNLIVEVSGYSFDGKVSLLRADIVRAMDALHKTSAVISLFNPEVSDGEPDSAVAAA